MNLRIEVRVLAPERGGAEGAPSLPSLPVSDLPIPLPPARGPYDAVLVVSFGGPERPEDLMPFLERVTMGRASPEKLEEVAAHYRHFGGISPINDQVRELLGALQAELAARGVSVPLYWGNRNWDPLLGDTLSQMSEAGVRRAVAIATSAFSSYSGCRQYWGDIEAAVAAVRGAPLVDKIPPFWDQEAFVAAVAEGVSETLAGMPEGLGANCELVFSAHSIPLFMAEASEYQSQLRQAAAEVTARVSRGRKIPWSLVFQSRSGPPSQQWLEPDISDYIATVASRRGDDGAPRAVVVVPIGFVSDHMEVLYDLDIEAAAAAADAGIAMVRAPTVGSRSVFVRGLVDLLVAALEGRAGPEGIFGPQQLCGVGCCGRGGR